MQPPRERAAVAPNHLRGRGLYNPGNVIDEDTRADHGQLCRPDGSAGWRGVRGLHPEMARIYRTKVPELAKALQEPESCSEATETLRGVVDAIVLTPG